MAKEYLGEFEELVLTMVGILQEDAYGNATIYFEIEGAHEELEVISSSFVELEEFIPPSGEKSPSWEQIRDACDAERWSWNDAITFPTVRPTSPTIATERPVV